MVARDIRELREEVARAERLARRKVNRIKRETSVETFGKYNPVRSSGKYRSYNRKQLESYLGQLNSFRSRSTQFVPDVRGRAVPRQIYKRYTKLFEQKSTQARQFFDAVEDHFMPSTGMTYGDRVRMTTPDHPNLHNPSANSLNNIRRRRASSFASEGAMKKFADQLEREMSGDMMNYNRKQAMKALRKMAKRNDAGWIVDELKTLSDVQFTALWNIRDFMDDMSLWYESEGLLKDSKITASEADQRIGPASRHIKKVIADIRKIK